MALISLWWADDAGELVLGSAVRRKVRGAYQAVPLTGLVGVIKSYNVN